MSYCNFTDFPPLSLSYLEMYLLNVKNDFYLIYAAFHLEVVYDRRDEILQSLGYFGSPPPAFLLVHVCALRVCLSPSLVTAWHLDKCVTVKSVNNGSMMNPYTICWCLSNRQREKKGRPNGTLYIFDKKINTTAWVHQQHK